MRCVICNSSMAYYFSKDFNAFGLTKVDYWRCPNCGFSMSKTHADMSVSEWTSLNHEYHSTYQGKDVNPDDLRWIARLQSQATVLGDAAIIGLLKGDGQWLDYACGDGKLSELLRNEGHTLLKYDRYMPRREDYLNDDEINPGRFDFVLTTSVFEHFTLREQFDSVEALVSDNGVLGLHTLVCESIPCDASWFYLLPVHCSFHTNKSMSLLFEQWAYASSVYNVDSRLWLWFKQSVSDIQEYVEYANRRPNGPSYIIKNGFVDYWK
ncbi:MAG: methyltransferase domain-containing protein [Syntrophales bacterium]